MADFPQIPSPSALKAPLDPDPAVWFNAERLKQLESDLLSARATLALSGLLPRAVDLWIRQQIAEEAPWSPDERQVAISARELTWRSSHDPSALGLMDCEVPLKLAVAPGCLSWAEAQWGHRLETLFLQHKSRLDKASCRLLRVTDKGLALELFHRIKAGEETFEDLARRFGEGPEKNLDGLIPLQPLSSMPYGLEKVLPKLKAGEVTPPSRLGQHVAVVQLKKFLSASFDDSSRQRLLADELDYWLKDAGSIALSHLMYLHRIDAVIP